MKKSVEADLLAANRALQRKKHGKYLRLEEELWSLTQVRKDLEEALHRLRREVAPKVKASTEQTVEKKVEEENEKCMQAAVWEYMLKKKITHIPVSEEMWVSIPRNPPASTYAHMCAWYRQTNRYYKQGRYTAKEDMLVLHHSGYWPVLYILLRRAPFSIYARFRELLSKQEKKNWTLQEDKMLAELVQKKGAESWVEIANHLGSKTARQCMYRYKRVLLPGTKKGRWSLEEDAALLHAIKRAAGLNWAEIQKNIPGRNSLQCRERYTYALDPKINNTPWTPDEEARLLEAAQLVDGRKWREIAKHVRTRNGKQCRRKYLGMRRASEVAESERKEELRQCTEDLHDSASSSDAA